MVGDPAWYDLPSLGRALKRPASIGRLVFTPPLSAYFLHQAITLVEMLAETFPETTLLYASHLKDRSSPEAVASDTGTNAALSVAVAEKNSRVRIAALSHGFEILDSDGTTELLSTYDSCDLHVGYECHAHLAFLRKRIPSVLIHEDARGVGYTYTLGAAGFDGFARSSNGVTAAIANGIGRKHITSGYATTPDELAIASVRDNLAPVVRRYIIEELQSNWRRIATIPDVIDRTYEEAMAPFLRSVIHR